MLFWRLGVLMRAGQRRAPARPHGGRCGPAGTSWSRPAEPRQCFSRILFRTRHPSRRPSSWISTTARSSATSTCRARASPRAASGPASTAASMPLRRRAGIPSASRAATRARRRLRAAPIGLPWASPIAGVRSARRAQGRRRGCTAKRKFPRSRLLRVAFGRGSGRAVPLGRRSSSTPKAPGFPGAYRV